MSEDQILTRHGDGDVVVTSADQDQNQPLDLATLPPGWRQWLYPYDPGP